MRKLKVVGCLFWTSLNWNRTRSFWMFWKKIWSSSWVSWCRSLFLRLASVKQRYRSKTEVRGTNSGIWPTCLISSSESFESEDF